jgi:hypothetical protein
MRRLGFLFLAATLLRMGGCQTQELAAPARTPTHLHKFEVACGLLGSPDSFLAAYGQSFVAGDLSAMSAVRGSPADGAAGALPEFRGERAVVLFGVPVPVLSRIGPLGAARVN